MPDPRQRAVVDDPEDRLDPTPRPPAALPGRRALFASLAAMATLAACKSPADLAVAAAGSAPSRAGDPEGTHRPSGSAGNPRPKQSSGAVPAGAVAPESPPSTGAGTPVVPVRVTVPASLTAEHVVRRLTYGPTPGLYDEVERTGLDAWIGRQLAPQSVPDPAGDAIDAWYPVLARKATDLAAEAKTNPAKARKEYFAAIPQRFTARAAWSSRQLLEVMVNFWSNHLNVHTGDKHALARHEYDALIRRNALGNFRDLLEASAESAEMLRYLNSTQSTKKQPNENYARELLELHTVGVGGGYTEADVQQSALLLTGWTANLDTMFAPSFKPQRHHAGPITVMGFHTENASADGGPAEIRKYLAYLAGHSSTAKHLATKLAIRFVADEPPPSLVDALAKAYLDNDTAIVPVLRTLFASPEFAASAGGAKVRRPFERFVATLRVLAPHVPAGPSGMKDLLGMVVAEAPFGHPSPDGYPDVAVAWNSPGVALELLNTTMALADGLPMGVGLPGPSGLLAHAPTQAGALVDTIAQRVLQRAATAAERRAGAAVLTGARLGPTFAAGSKQHHAAITAVATVLLCTPSHLVR
jgi:uncharacterized protein (DUF1800 family)